MTLAVSIAQGGSNNVTFRNRIINGAMVIDQRNAGASATPSTNTYLVDRWAYVSSQASKFTWGQNLNSVTLPAGFSNYLGGSVASAVSVGSTDYFQLIQQIEGYNIADLAWGTSAAKTVTLSFQVYSSLTGTFGGAITNSANDRSYPFSYSIPVANTWTTISITVAGPTTGTWLTTNGSGLIVRYGLGVGATYSGTAGAWANTVYVSSTGAVSVVGTAGATFYITGVQLEAGSTATPFEYRQYGTELALCQRYFYRNVGSTGGSGYTGVASGRVTNATTVELIAPLPVVMRSSPTLTFGGNVYANDGGASNPLTLSTTYTGMNAVFFVATSGAGGWTAGRGVIVYTGNGATNYLDFASEL